MFKKISLHIAVNEA